MQRNTEKLRDQKFDVLVVGGGITGACLAHDAALRGLSVALVERGDFACATSSASSKLLHGGVRYLQQIQLAKVRESAFESAFFQRIAPHLSRWVPFLVPTYRSLAKGRALIRAGMALYEALTVGRDGMIEDPAKKAPANFYLDRATLLDRVPLLAGRRDLTGAQVLHESHMYNSERMVLAFVKASAENGAVIGNYLCLVGFLHERGAVAGGTVRDELTGETFPVRATVVANAAGPWIPALNRSLSGATLSRPVTRFSSGAHIVTRLVHEEFALAVGTPRAAQTLVDRGGRHVFVIPWRNHSLIGTTNSPYAGDLDSVRPTETDVASLLADVNAALPGASLDRHDVRYSYAGLYPLVEEVVRPEVYQGTGEYQVVDHAAGGGVDGLISVLGAKYTTARKVAESGADLLERKLGRAVTPCRTATTPLRSGDIPRLETFTAGAIERYASRVPEATIRHLVSSYGTEIDAVMAAGAAHPSGFSQLAADRESIEAEVIYAVEHELAARLEDVVFRRTGLGTLGHPGQRCLHRCVELMGARLGWTEEMATREIERVELRLSVPTA
jgi:glycerol-3-phosphate dehydrogenase